MIDRNTFVLIMSFLFVFLLTLFPITPALNDFYPIWIIPLLIYWMRSAPQRIGLFVAWCSGLTLDALFNSLFGAHALALLILAACFGAFSKRFGFFSILQQMFTVFFLTLLYLTLLTGIKLFTHQPITFSLWQALTTAIAWPLVAGILGHYHKEIYTR